MLGLSAGFASASQSPRPIAISSEAATDAKQMGYGLRAWGTVNGNESTMLDQQSENIC